MSIEEAMVMSSDNPNLKCLGVTPLYFEDEYWMRVTAIATSVICSLSSVFSTIANVLVLVALYRLKLLHQPSNILIANLCVADLLVGLIVDPLFVIARALELSNIQPCALKQAGTFWGYTLCGVSICNLSLISIDRWYAITKPFEYARNVTIKHCIPMIVLIYVFCITFTSFHIVELIPTKHFYILLAFLLTSLIFLSLSCYVQIYRIARSHERRIISLKAHLSEAEPETTQKENKLDSSSVETSSKSKKRFLEQKEGRKSKTIIFIVTLCVISYFPKVILMLDEYLVHDHSKLSYEAVKWSEVLFMLNSSFNPLIYSLRMKRIKQELAKLCDNTITQCFWCKNKVVDYQQNDAR